MVKLQAFEYHQSEMPFVKWGVKNNKTPNGTIRGSNGSFFVVKSPKVECRNSNDEKCETKNYYGLIKDYASQRVTEKYCEKVLKEVKGKKI